MVTIIVNNAVIKGYHVFKKTPPLDVSLNVEYEPFKSTGTLLVWYYKQPTEPDNASGDHGKVSFGHVQSELSKSFKDIIYQGGSINAFATGPPRDSSPPGPQRFVEGGGKVIPCYYIIKTEQRCCVSSLESALKGSAMTLSVSET